MCYPLCVARELSSSSSLYSKRPDFLGCILGFLNKTCRSLQSLLEPSLAWWNRQKHSLLLALLLLLNKTSLPTSVKAITESSNQLYPVTLQPFSAAVNYLYLVVGCWGGVIHAGLHSGCFLNS